ncbi:MAG: 4Fe-4S dicluster domain-containing protein [Chitinivibrionales bacterium]|nr:4Fe-4S dicluster domain-containing protein [Chitinivibrionales bacterium]
MDKRIKGVADVAAWRLCLGCGACAGVCPHGAITLVDVLKEGIRPMVDSERCRGCGTCLGVCPGFETAHDNTRWPAAVIGHLGRSWGPVLDIWEGHAADAELRYAGASGGAASALAAYCLARMGMAGVVHTAPATERPWKNATVVSRTPEELLLRAASRYAPASPCDALRWAAARGGRFVFIGKPCDVAAVRRAAAISSEIEDAFGCLISLFCAGTPGTLGTIDLLEHVGVLTSHIAELRFRGRGWPGAMAVRLKDAEAFESKMSYRDSWKFLQRYRPYRCHLCPDGTGEFADIACGDPWYRKPQPAEPGASLVVARTERGRQLVEAAIADGYLVMNRANPDILTASQGSLLAKRQAVWGRALAFRLHRLPYPQLRGFSLLANWATLPTRQKALSILGTLRRIRARRYYQPSHYSNGPLEPHDNELCKGADGIRGAGGAPGLLQMRSDS